MSFYGRNDCTFLSEEEIERNSYEYLFKYIIIGDPGVGKSCLSLQFTRRKFRNTYDLTIGVDCDDKTIIIDNKRVKIKIYDTAGQERFMSLTGSFYRGVCVALLVYDITRRETFDHLAGWLQEVRRRANENITTILVGNKSDLEKKRSVRFEEGEQFAKDHGLIFFEASARTAQNVEKVFFESAIITYKMIQCGILDVSNEENGIMLGYSYVGKPSPPSGGCCS